MKTIKQHLESFPEPYRTQALDNTEENILNDTDLTTADLALGMAFVWAKSPQKHLYWSKFNKTLQP